VIRAPRADELARVAAFIATRQAQAESRDAMFDERADAIAAQLAAWERPWVDTSRVAERKGRLVGFVGVELDRDSTGRPDIGSAVANGLRRRGVLVGATGPLGNVIKIRPPLVFAEQHADRLAVALDATLTEELR